MNHATYSAVIFVVSLWQGCVAMRADTNVTIEDLLTGSCCCKKERCKGRRSGDNPLYEYNLNGNNVCCKQRGSGFSDFGGLMSCPWYGYSEAAVDVLPHVAQPCSCHWKVWSGKPKFSDVAQGQLGSCYLLASLASLAYVQPKVIENLFVSQDMWAGSNPVFRTTWLIDGKSIVVAVNPTVPVDKETEQPFFSTYNNGHDFWPVILEKAFAKIYGSYKAIEAGFASEVIYAISGAPMLNVDRPSSAEEKETTWQDLKVSVDNKYPLWANNDNGVHGLSDGHAYAVLGLREIKIGRIHSRALHVYNPWSHNYYDGLLKDMRQADGSFWMTLDEFWENFVQLEVAELRPTYREVSLDLGKRFKSAKAVLKLRMRSDTPFTVSVSTLHKRFFQGTQCENLTNSKDLWLYTESTPAGGEHIKKWWQGNTYHMSFAGKAGEYKIYAKVAYTEKNWDSRVMIYADKNELVGDDEAVLTEIETVRADKLDDCHAGAGNYENLDNWHDLREGRKDDWFPPQMASIAYEGTYCGDTAQGIHVKCDKFNNWGSFIKAVC